MKPAILLSTIIALAIALVACSRESAPVVPQEAGIVLFPDAGISIEVGEGWKRHESPAPPICSPMLVGEQGLVQVILLPQWFPNVQTATDSMRSRLMQLKVPCHQEAFTTGSGLNGQRIFYSSGPVQGKSGNVIEIRNDNFYVQRHDGRVVEVSCITFDTNSAPVLQTIQKSLKLQ